MLIRLFLALLITMTSASIVFAESHDCSYVAHIERVVSRQVINVGPPGHEVIYLSRLDRLDKMALSDFVAGQEWVFNVADEMKGTGSHSGWYEWVSKSGDKLFGTYRGTHAVDGPVRTSQGKFDITGGTGRYEKATGAGEYKGRAAPDAPFEETATCTINYLWLHNYRTVVATTPEVEQFSQDRPR